MGEFDIKTYTSENEKAARNNLVKLFKNSPLPDDQILSNLGLYLNSKTLSRILFMNHLYSNIVNLQGVAIEFGCHWGQNLSLFSALRGIYEPFNRHRKIIGFDTFTGFSSIDLKDGGSDLMREGNLLLPSEYDDYLREILKAQEADNPLSHIPKFEVIKGDASITFNKYLEDHPETIIALAYFDFDIYKPTRDCLRMIKSRLVRGSVVGFDELNDPDSPGETVALMEEIGLNKIKLMRFPITSRTSYFIYEGN
ncbi:MAG: crotonobetainyl-CoA--carnitine CoA-transferase [Candidatus Omnitrophica bacterium]|jgi:hypothetical protein|nr:crotonobetainyl-CoA--carnitine CoA-transferase [Candidatus Omnitrophota bacterium]